MHQSLKTTAAGAAIALLLAACGGSAGATVTTTGSEMGKILTGQQGMTLYLYKADKSTASTCYNSCAQLWPPLLTSGTATAGSGVDGGKLGTTKRTDGTTQVTYAGHPLYYYAGDKQAGQTTGEGVTDSGGEWDAVSPSGTAVEKAGS